MTWNGRQAISQAISTVDPEAPPNRRNAWAGSGSRLRRAGTLPGTQRAVGLAMSGAAHLPDFPTAAECNGMRKDGAQQL